MKKYRVFIIIAIVLLILPFSVTIGDFSFTTKYYTSPAKAFNAESPHSRTYGWVEVHKELGTVMLDDKTGLFLGEFEDNHFLIAKMSVKNGKYFYSGEVIYYDMSDPDVFYIDQTKCSNGFVKWSVTYSDTKSDKETPPIDRVESFVHSSGNTISLTVYK